jgi:hypothetical protein
MALHLTVMLFIFVTRDPQIGNIYLLSLLIDRLSEGQFVLTFLSKTFRQFEKYIIFGTFSSTYSFFVLLKTY